MAAVARNTRTASTWIYPLIMGLFVVCAIVVHRFVSGGFGSWHAGVGAPAESPNTAVFAAIGFLFLALTWLAHVPIGRAKSSRFESTGPLPQGGAIRRGGPLATLLLPMAIRFAGTFVIFGGLWFSSLIGRGEAAFDVLFWYVSLTTLEVAGIVWASRTTVPDEQSSVASQAGGS